MTLGSAHPSLEHGLFLFTLFSRWKHQDAISRGKIFSWQMILKKFSLKYVLGSYRFLLVWAPVLLLGQLIYGLRGSGQCHQGQFCLDRTQSGSWCVCTWSMYLSIWGAFIKCRFQSIRGVSKKKYSLLVGPRPTKGGGGGRGLSSQGLLKVNIFFFATFPYTVSNRLGI